MNWWYARGSEKQGPIEDALFREMVRDGRVAPDDLVWNESMATWMKAGNVPGLFPQAGETGPGETAGGDGDTPIMDLFQKAYDCMSGRFWLAVGVTLLLQVVAQAAGMAAGMVDRMIGDIPIAAILISLAISGPLAVGQASFFLTYPRRQPADVATAFSGFNMYGRNCLAFLLVMVFTILWMLLLIVPGIIKSYSYAMTWYILADNPEMTPMQAIDRSMEIMDGRKLKLFGYSLLLFLINIAGLLCCCVGIFITTAYTQVAVAQFYEDVKYRNMKAGVA